jgi:photosystem II stability/assembly factor-like uncharacterized protein
MYRVFHLLTALVSVAIGTAAAEPCDVSYDFRWSNPQPQGNPLHGMAYESASTGYAVGLGGATVRTTDAGATWTDLTDHDFGLDLHDVHALGGGEILAVGAAPGIFRSIDGGARWQAVANPSTAILTDLSILSPTVFTAAGEHGQVLRSTDAGESWTLLAAPADRTIQEQYWSDADHGYVVGLFVARKTTDGGQSWQPVPGVDESANFNEVFFTDALHGAILEDFGIWKTTNGGAFWSFQMSAGDEPVYLGDTYPFGNDHWLLTTNLEGATVWESTNAGDTWDLLVILPSGGFLDFERLEDGRFVGCTDLGDLLVSSDNGQSWMNATRSPGDGERVSIYSMAFLPNGIGYAGGRSSFGLSRFLRSTDHGLSWTERTPAPGVWMTAMQFKDLQIGAVGGDEDVVGVTSDGGAVWTTRSLTHNFPSPMRVSDFAFPAGGDLFAAAFGQGSGTVFRSTDSGASWQRRDTGMSTSLFYLGTHFLNATTGYVCGGTTNLPRIYKTTNAGANWSLVPTAGMAQFIQSVHWYDEQTALAAVRASPGGLFRTTNGGTLWAPVIAEEVRRLSIVDALHGAALLETGDRVAVTCDGGATWEIHELPIAGHFVRAQCVFAEEDGFFVGGDNSLIMEARALDPASAPEVVLAPGTPSIWTLWPYAGSPRILVRAAVGASARVDVFDAIGRRIRTLRDASSSNGRVRTFEWDGLDGAGRPQPSGVYLARLAPGRAEDVARVMLLR